MLWDNTFYWMEKCSSRNEEKGGKYNFLNWQLYGEYNRHGKPLNFVLKWQKLPKLLSRYYFHPYALANWFRHQSISKWHIWAKDFLKLETTTISLKLITCLGHRNLQNIRIWILQIFCYDVFAWSKVGRIAPDSCNLF